MLVVSRILAVFFTYRDNSAAPNISRNFFPAIRNLKKIRPGGLVTSQSLHRARLRPLLPVLSKSIFAMTYPRGLISAAASPINTAHMVR